MGIYVRNKRYAPYIGDKRREVRNKKALLYDAEVEYIENTGGALFNTGLHLSSYNCKYDIKYMQNANTSAIGFLIIQNNPGGSENNNRIAIYSNASNRLSSVWGNKWQASSTSSDRNPHVMTLYNRQLYRDRSSIVSANAPESFPSSSSTVYIWDETYQLSSRLYWCKIYNDSSLVMDLIPVRKGQTGYLYDRISGNLIANTGSGNVSLGADIPTTYDAQVEYLRGTGTQYVDSEIECTGDLSVKGKFRASTDTANDIAGSIYDRGSSYYIRHHLRASSNNFYWLQNDSGSPSILHSFSTNTWYEFEIDATNGTYNINGTTGTFTPVSADVSTKDTYGIFARLAYNLITNIRGGNVDIAYYQLKRGGVLLRDFIPVRVGQDGYLYDKVSKRIFVNRGTGDFILGNDKN